MNDALDVERALLRQIDTVAAHLQLRSAAARVCAELGDGGEYRRWSALAEAARRRLAIYEQRLARYLAHAQEYAGLLTDAERAELLRRLFGDTHPIGGSQ